MSCVSRKYRQALRSKVSPHSAIRDLFATQNQKLPPLTRPAALRTMAEYVSRFYINLSDRATNMALGLFVVKMKVVMNHNIFNAFIEVINNTMSDILNQISSDMFASIEKMIALEEAFDQIRNFFGEDADVVLDMNLESHGLMTAVDLTADWIEPIAEFLAPVPEPRRYDHTEITFGETNQIQDLFIRSGVMA